MGNDSPRKWTDLPANAQVDAALRRAAAGVCGFIENDCEFCDPAKSGRTIGKVAWLRRWNRDHIARVFVAALASLPNDERGWANATQQQRDTLSGIWSAWSDALEDPRAALCALLDLLQVPVPQEIQQ